MARLTSLPSRLTAPGHRIGRAPTQTEGPKRHRDSAPWRAWYKLARWRRLRQEVLTRDNYTCQRTGIICGGKSPAPDSPVVNHKKAHRGNEALFWSIDNLEVVSKAVHDSEIQSEEQASLHHRGVWD